MKNISSGTGFFGNMHRSATQNVIGGVCGGLAEQTSIPARVFRAGFVLLCLLFGIGLILYIILWIFVPLRFIYFDQNSQ
jgi:phage shock protein PspC (stress-responsive transcriptional regulator)